MSSFINYNGNAVDAELPVIPSSNRAFRYGDAVFETIRLMNGDVLFLEKHLLRLTKAMKALGMKVPENYTMHYFYLLIRHLDQVNNLHGNGRVRLEVFRNDGGYYTPQDNTVSFIIEAEPLMPKDYTMNEIGLKVDFYKELRKSFSKISAYKTANALHHVLGGIFKAANNLDDCLLLNTEEKVCEAIGSNVFIIKNDILFTPPLSEGCVDGVMRDHLISRLKEQGRQVTEIPLSIEEIMNADEVFLSDVINGIRWGGSLPPKALF